MENLSKMIIMFIVIALAFKSEGARNIKFSNEKKVDHQPQNFPGFGHFPDFHGFQYPGFPRFPDFPYPDYPRDPVPGVPPGFRIPAFPPFPGSPPGFPHLPGSGKWNFPGQSNNVVKTNVQGSKNVIYPGFPRFPVITGEFPAAADGGVPFLLRYFRTLPIIYAYFGYAPPRICIPFIRICFRVPQPPPAPDQPIPIISPSAQPLPGQSPPLQAPPVQTPPIRPSPAQTPQVQIPPIQSPSTENPPVQSPSVEMPPMIHSPSVQPPSIQSPSTQTPMAQSLFVEMPPLINSSLVQPPFTQSPSVEVPPVQIPPVQTPSVQSPPVQTGPVQIPLVQSMPLNPPEQQLVGL